MWPTQLREKDLELSSKAKGENSTHSKQTWMVIPKTHYQIHASILPAPTYIINLYSFTMATQHLANFKNSQKLPSDLHLSPLSFCVGKKPTNYNQFRTQWLLSTKRWTLCCCSFASCSSRNNPLAVVPWAREMRWFSKTFLGACVSTWRVVVV